MTMKPRPGNVPAPKPDKYLFRQLFRQKAAEQFAGTKGTMEELKSEDGQAKIATARSEAETTLGFSLETIEAQDFLEDLYSDLQYAKPRPKDGESEMGCCEPEGII